jgi:hypothetical protein
MMIVDYQDKQNTCPSHVSFKGPRKSPPIKTAIKDRIRAKKAKMQIRPILRPETEQFGQILLWNHARTISILASLIEQHQ